MVVLDRIRELLRIDPTKPLADTINDAVNSTLSRTVFTSVTTLLALLPMALFGGDAVESFAVPMVLPWSLAPLQHCLSRQLCCICLECVASNKEKLS